MQRFSALDRKGRNKLADRLIKALFIDVDDTLLDFNACAKESMEAAFAMRNAIPPENAFDVFLKHNRVLWKRIEDKTLDLQGLMKIRWNIIFEELGIGFDGYEFELDFRTYLAESHIKIEGADEILEYLSAKYPIYVTSNSPEHQQQNRMSKAGLSKYITDYFPSGRIGFSKPDIRFFEGCIALVDGIKPEEIMMIGDSLNADIKGGKICGLNTIWFNPQNKPLNPDILPDYTINSLSELKSIL